MIFKKIIAWFILTSMNLAVAMFELVYSVVDRIYPSEENSSGIYTRENIFEEEPYDEFKENFAVIICLIISIIMILVLIKIDIKLTEYLGYLMRPDYFRNSF